MGRAINPGAMEEQGIVNLENLRFLYFFKYFSRRQLNPHISSLTRKFLILVSFASFFATWALRTFTKRAFTRQNAAWKWIVLLFRYGHVNSVRRWYKRGKVRIKREKGGLRQLIKKIDIYETGFSLSARVNTFLWQAKKDPC